LGPGVFPVRIVKGGVSEGYRTGPLSLRDTGRICSPLDNRENPYNKKKRMDRPKLAKGFNHDVEPF
jgi:hypothetical protein